MSSVKFCLLHEECEHFEIYCECNQCYTEEAQCQFLFEEKIDNKKNGRPKVYELGLDGPKDESLRLANHYEPQEQPDLYCTEEICDTAIEKRGKTPQRRNSQGIEFQTDSEIYPQLQIRERTPELLYFSFPDTGSNEHRRYIHIANKHFKSVDKKYSNKQDVRISTTTLDIQIRKNMDTERESVGTNPGISSENNTGCTGNNNESSIPNSTSNDGLTRSTTMVPTSEQLDDTHNKSGTKRRSRSRTPELSSTPTTTPKQTKKQRTTINECSETEKYYTFILHKNNQRDDWKSNRAKGPGPSFITFDHGDHYHIVYGAANESNASRARKRIVEYMGANVKGCSEAHITTSKIKLLSNFILYCLRYGLRTINHYGNKIIKIVKMIEDLFEHHQNDEIDEIDADGICRQYVEDQKEQKKKRVGKEKQKTLCEIIIEQIQKYNIQHYGQWDRQVPHDLRIQLIQEWGISTDSYIKSLIKIKKSEKLQEVKNKTIPEILLEKHEFLQLESIDVDCCRWIEYWMEENEIDIPNLLAWFEIIRNKTLKKINCMVIQGPTNAGKSLFIRSLTDLIKAEQMPRENDNSQFKLDQLPTATCAVFEEPLITPNNVGTWKLLTEGAEVTTDIKNKDKEPIPRIPIYITTEANIHNNIDKRETEQLYQRLKLFKFKRGITHLQDSSALTSEVISRQIRAPPAYISSKHWLIIYIKFWKEIQRTITTIKSNHIIDEDNEILYPEDIHEKILTKKLELEILDDNGNNN